MEYYSDINKKKECVIDTHNNLDKLSNFENFNIKITIRIKETSKIVHPIL